MASLNAALSTFVQSIISIFAALANAVFAVFHAIFALGQEIVNAMVQLSQAAVQLGFDLLGDAFSFVTANFFVLLLLGGGYYWYTNREGQRGRRPA